jgi:hypothetical protein
LISPDFAGKFPTRLVGSTCRACGPATGLWAPDEAARKVRNIGLRAPHIVADLFAHAQYLVLRNLNNKLIKKIY